MSFADIDAADLWDEIHRRLGIEDKEGNLSPLVTLVKPIRLVTLIKQDTVVLGEDTCPSGSVDLPSRGEASPSRGEASSFRAEPSTTTAELHAILDKRLAAYDRERESADRVRHDALLAAVNLRLGDASRTEPDGGAGRSALTLEDSHQRQVEVLVEGLEARLRSALEDRARPSPRAGSSTNKGLEEAIRSVRSELRAVRSLLSQERPTRGELARPEAASFTPSTAEPEGPNVLPPEESAVAHPIPAQDARSELPGLVAQGSTQARVNEPARSQSMLFPWSSLLVLSLAFVFFTCGVVVHAMLAKPPMAADAEDIHPAQRSTPTPGLTYPSRPNPVAEESPGPVRRAGSRPSSSAAEPGEPALLDSDGDGLYDPGQPGLKAAMTDRCPTIPGPSEGQGCPGAGPSAELPERLRALDGVIEGVNFDVDRATLRPDSIEILDRAVTVLREHPTVRIEISGHTDSAGGYQHNIDLSQSRAETVRKYLVDRGLAGDRFETVGYGPDRPIDDNRTRPGRLRNRRIEFKLLK